MFRAFNLSSKYGRSQAEKILLTYQTFAISVKVPTPYTTQPPCHNCVAILGVNVRPFYHLTFKCNLYFNLPTYEFFSQRRQILKKCVFVSFFLFFFFFFFFFGGGGGGLCGAKVDEGGVDGCTEEQSQTNLPLQLHRLGGITMH